MNRDSLIKFIPKPTNSEVIVYDISLKNLIDVDVLQEYNKLYPIFVSKRENYINCKERIKEYESAINNIYLYKPSWSEIDYLESLKNDKKTYSTLFGEIKKIENNIAMLQRNLKGINEKIEIQKAKENKKINDKKETIEKDIEKNKEKLLNLKKYLDSYNFALKEIEERIKDNEDEFEMLASMQSKLNEGKCKCEYCGRTVTSTGEDSIFYKRLYNNIEKNKTKLEKLLKEKEKIDLNIAFYENELKQVKDNLNNDIQFKKENSNFYTKKNLEILKLEAIRDDMLNKINEFEKQLASNSKTKTQSFLNLKSNIEKYELSIDNLNKMKELKESMQTEIENFNNIKEETKQVFHAIEQYLKFIKIYYKILEQKASQYCGNDLKFKLCEIEEYKLKPILEIFYKGINYQDLQTKEKEKVDTILAEKFSIYF